MPGGDTRTPRSTETRWFDVVAEPELLDALSVKARAYGVQARAWWRPRWQAARDWPTTAERGLARKELEQERKELRCHGELLDTASAIITYHLGVELTERGWNHDDWPELPAGTTSVGGRRRGSRNRKAGEDEPAPRRKLRVTIGKALAERLLHATYTVSKPATTALEELADARNNGISPERYTAEYARLSEDVVTSGDVLRDVLDRAISDFYPTTEPVPSTEPKLWEEPELIEHIPPGQPGIGFVHHTLTTVTR